MIGSFVLFNSLNYNSEQYDDFSDEELIEKMKDGDEYAERCLYKRYIFVVKRITSSFFIIGGNMDDLFQESMIGLIKAVKSYKAGFGNRFRSYAEVCIRRQIISAIRKSKVNNIINNNISIFDCHDIENVSVQIDKFVEMDKLNPESVFINKEEKNDYLEITSKLLSEFERVVLTEYGKGKSYEEISLALNKDIKSIDNALQRVKKKICGYKEKLIF